MGPSRAKKHDIEIEIGGFPESREEGLGGLEVEYSGRHHDLVDVALEPVDRLLSRCDRDRTRCWAAALSVPRAVQPDRETLASCLARPVEGSDLDDVILIASPSAVGPTPDGLVTIVADDLHPGWRAMGPLLRHLRREWAADLTLWLGGEYNRVNIALVGGLAPVAYLLECAREQVAPDSVRVGPPNQRLHVTGRYAARA